jgi:site-specific DNA-methyltransferase (adenine-specific)
MNVTDRPELIEGVTPYYHDAEAGIAVYHADCRDVLPLIPEGSVDLVLTDPPYGHNNNNNGDLAHRREEALGLVKRGEVHAGAARPIANDGFDAACELVQFVYAEAGRVLKPGCCCCCCGGGGGPDPQFARWSLWLDDAVGFKQAVVWDKGGLGMGWHYRRNYELMLVGQKPGAACKWNGGNTTANVIQGIPGIKPGEDEHPTPKPVDLMRRFVWLHSDTGDLVLDPCLGGGPTLVAAKTEGRKAIGIDVDERWCSLTLERLRQGVFDFGKGEK